MKYVTMVSSLKSKGIESMKKKYLIITLSALILVAVLATVSMNAFADVDNNLICKGIYINTIDLSNMTAEQAKDAVDKYIEERKAKKVVIDVDGEQVSTTVGELGFSAVENDFIEKALQVGKSGNFIKRFKEMKDVENGSIVYQLEFTLDDEKVNEFVAKAEEFNVEPQNSKLSRVNGRFVATESVDGKMINSEHAKTAVKEAILNNWDGNDITVIAHLEEQKAEFTKEMVSKCQDLLGSFSTTYRDSSTDRASNLANGAKKIDGSIIYPGESFSVYEKLKPFTEENGWSAAGAYLNGMVVDSIGGGACQVSTTLYNALLMAELNITERAPHSMTVSYVEPAMDAAIAGTYKDLKFKNDTNAPIYIESYTKGRTITFNIYGEETRPSNRTIKYESEILEKKAPGEDVITEDPTKPTSYRKVTQSAHYAYKANLWKIVYIDGKEVSREKVNYSSYRSSPKYVTVGTKEEAPVETVKPSETPTVTTTPTTSPTPAPAVTPKPTEKPVQTEAPAESVTPEVPGGDSEDTDANAVVED